MLRRSLRRGRQRAIKLVPLRPTGALGALEDESQRQAFALDTEGAKHFAYAVDLHNNYLAAVAKTSVPFRAHEAQGYLHIRDGAQRIAKMRYGTPVDASLTQRHE